MPTPSLFNWGEGDRLIRVGSRSLTYFIYYYQITYERKSAQLAMS